MLAARTGDMVLSATMRMSTVENPLTMLVICAMFLGGGGVFFYGSLMTVAKIIVRTEERRKMKRLVKT